MISLKITSFLVEEKGKVKGIMANKPSLNLQVELGKTGTRHQEKDKK